MLFNLDRNIKQSLLEEYKKEALLHRQKKQMEKQQKLKEEQEYLENLNKQEEKEYKKLKEKENVRRNDQMKYYQEILNSPDKISRKKELIINNWGQPRNKSNSYKEIINNFRKETNSNKYDIDYNTLSPVQRQKIYIRKDDDHMENYLTDDQSKDEITKYLKEEKNYRQKYYKDLVNSQYEEAQRINKERYGTNDVLIIENKKKNFFNENMYISNKRYDFGKSNLMHNPIINPENDISYNKYINFRLNKSNVFKNALENKNNISNLKEINNKSSSLLGYNNEYIIPNKKILIISNNNNSNELIKSKDNKYNSNSQSESNALNNIEIKNENLNLTRNNYGSFSKDNIFDYKQNKKFFNSNNSTGNEISNNFDYKTIENSNESILSQAAKRNFLL